ncbi:MULTISPECIES: carbohydrate ABC transporter permease [unclassified Ruegeria]|uniref:carbohydrate ABC transporter permease n=1 Tax=unclassified Ruegeria TaxID=2625375 RepID=UPI001488FD27|nr:MULTISPECIES: carbohydrate ABC transporter permease [unclassified Ruegeria]
MSAQNSTTRWRAFGLHAFILPLALVWLMPIWLMFVFATLGDKAIFSPEIQLWPGSEFFTNFERLQEDLEFVRTVFVSFVVALVYTAASVVLTSMAGWAIAIYSFRGKWVVLGLILGTLTLPYFVVVIPQFIMVARDFGLSNTWFALVVPPLFNSLGVLFMRQAFASMPKELFDAARVEGVKEWQIFVFVAMPLAKPMLAALSIILFLHSWNNYLWPLLISNDKTMMTAPVALGSLFGLVDVSWGGVMVGATLMTAPMLVVFVFLQRFFLAGITAGAIK